MTRGLPLKLVRSVCLCVQLACVWLNGRGRRAVSSMATDPWGVGRGLHLATLGLELPIQVPLVTPTCGEKPA